MRRRRRRMKKEEETYGLPYGYFYEPHKCSVALFANQVYIIPSKSHNKCGSNG
jgi:hypothetical protein